MIITHDKKSAEFSLPVFCILIKSGCNVCVVQGYIANITEKGCFVRFLKHLTGLASIPQVADEFVSDANHHFTVGQSVRAHVLEVGD
jgi:predicted RNA-binding protein with RPS1 domain